MQLLLYIVLPLFIRPAAARCGTDAFLAPLAPLHTAESLHAATDGRALQTTTCQDTFINPADTMMLWDIETIDFGVMKRNETLSVQYSFLNASRDTLTIEIVSACDCMDIDWTSTAIVPGARGTIEILYNPKDASGPQKKDIDVIMKNTDKKGYPLVRRAVLKGIVE